MVGEMGSYLRVVEVLSLKEDLEMLAYSKALGEA